MALRILTVLFAAVLLVACQTGQEQGAGGAGAGGAAGAGAGGGDGGQVSNVEQAQQAMLEIGDRVFFDTDKSQIRSSGARTLSQQVAFLKANPSVQIVIEGHADERGTREYNLALGVRRAQAVRDFMVNRGIAPSRIETVSYGKERPAVPGHTESAWQQNRRAVTVVRGMAG